MSIQDFTMLPTPANQNPNTWRNPAQTGNGNVTVPCVAGYTPPPVALQQVDT